MTSTLDIKLFIIKKNYPEQKLCSFNHFQYTHKRKGIFFFLVNIYISSLGLKVFPDINNSVLPSFINLRHEICYVAELFFFY